MGRWTGHLSVGLGLLAVLLTCCYAEENYCFAARDKTCSQCLQTGINCAYCPVETFNGPRCDLRRNLIAHGCGEAAIITAKSSMQIIKKQRVDVNLQKSQVSPQEMSMRLLPGDERLVDVEVFSPTKGPLDLYILMDFSNSMADDLNNLKRMGTELAKLVEDLSADYTIGFGKFVDKVIEPQTDMRPSKLAQPWPNSDPPFSFKNVIKLTNDVNEFNQKLQRERISGNLDAPEGGFDAILQAAVCTDQIGWRDHSTHLLVFSTESAFHYESDGANVLSGILKRNDEKCHLDEDDSYTEDTTQDYPSIPTLVRVLGKHNIIPIFAVTAHSYTYYEKLQKYFPIAEIGLLQEDSSNILQLMRTAFENIRSKMSIRAEDKLKAFEPQFLHTNGSLAKYGEFNIKPGAVGKFKMRLKANRMNGDQPVCSMEQDEKEGLMRVKPTTFSTAMRVNASILCPTCACEQKRIINAPRCNGNGDLVCGKCQCHDGWVSTFCNCSVTASAQDNSQCIGPDMKEPCSGRGDCLACGTCVCYNPEQFEGQYCQYDRSQCQRYGGFLCNDRGSCIMGQCVCAKGWEGKACECPKSNQTCLDSKGGVCNGRGKCVCGRCECGDSGIQMTATCEPNFQAQLGTCEATRSCVQCQAWKTGERKDKDKCDLCPFKITLVDKLKEAEKVLDACTFRDEDDDCTYHYTVENPKDPTIKGLEVQVLEKKDCPPASLLWLLPLLLFLLLLLGLLLLCCWKFCPCCKTCCQSCLALLPCCRRGRMVGFKEDEYMLRQSLLTSDHLDTPMVRTGPPKGTDVVRWKVTDNVHRQANHPQALIKPNPKETIQYPISVRLNRLFSENLSRPESRDAEQLRKEVADNLNEVYKQIPGAQKVQKTAFRMQRNAGKRQDYTIMDTVLSAPRSSFPDIVKLTEKNVQSGNIHNLKVLPGYYTVATDREAAGAIEFQEGVESVDVHVPLFVKDEDDDKKKLLVEAVDVPLGIAEIGKRLVNITIIKEQATNIFSFLQPAYTYSRQDGVANIPIMREIKEEGRTQVTYRTRDLTAKDKKDYVAVEGDLSYGPGETQKIVPVRLLELNEKDGLLEDKQVKQFVMDLSNPRQGAKLGRYPRTTITIADQPDPGVIMFKKGTQNFTTNDPTYTIPVVRTRNPDSPATVKWRTKKAQRFDLSGPLKFSPGETEKNIVIDPRSHPGPVQPETFQLELFDPSSNASLGERKTTLVNVTDGAPRSPETAPMVQMGYINQKATSPGGRLLSPANLKAKATGPRNIRLNWDPPPGNPMGYKVKYWIYGDPEKDAQVLDVKTTQAELTNLYPYCDYEMRVCGYNALGDGHDTDMVSCQTLEDVPGEPGRLAFNVISPTVTQLSWAEPAETNGNITAYEVIYTPIDDDMKPVGAAKKVKIDNPKKRMLLIENLQNAQTYQYKVRAMNSKGWGPFRDATINLASQPARPLSIPIIPDIPIVDAEAGDEYDSYLMYSNEVMKSPAGSKTPSVSGDGWKYVKLVGSNLDLRKVSWKKRVDVIPSRLSTDTESSDDAPHPSYARTALQEKCQHLSNHSVSGFSPCPLASELAAIPSVLPPPGQRGALASTAPPPVDDQSQAFPGAGLCLSSLHPTGEVIQSFLLQVSGNRLTTALFQLAICGGSLAVPQDLVPKEKASNTNEPTKTENKPATNLPSEAKVKQYLKDSLSSQNSAITLAHMASLERKLAKHFQVKDFLCLEQGNFLEFLVKNIQLLQETLGSTLILSSGSMDLAGSGFRPTRQDVFEFIKQCGDITPTDPDELSRIESALRSHYRVRDSRDLGYGPLQMLSGLVQRQRGLAGGGLSQVYYESALFAKYSKSSADVGCEAVGRLGEMSKAKALASLLSCPLLEDLNEWSQWELVFKPLHGSLREFIERNAANSGLAALEVTPGLLLRITTHTGDKHFSSAAMTLDPVGTAGHLVSMVAADGIVNAPTALLANHMHSSLAAAVAREDLSQAEEDVSCYSRVAKFLLACLTRIPTRTCQALLQQVFLEPFSLVLGQAKSKQVLITVAQSDPKHMNCLHRLGILLGITDWLKDYQKKLNPPQSQNNNTYTAPVEQPKTNLIDSESSSLSALNMSEDEDLDIMDNGFASSHLNQSLQQVNGEQDVVVEDGEDGEELYELASLPNGETSDVSSEAEGGQDPEQSDMSDSNEKDPASCQPETTLDLQRAIIEDIRKSEFGIGVELTAEGQKLLRGQQERLGRSLDRLSTELYSKDTHFVLELIQNADDNSYPAEAGVVPALAFVVERDSITVLNNETGFQEKNIRAICDVGQSTKGKHKYGYIGQKGIGFKSVFKVTDCPEIHSNGFHLRFDKNCGPMGYILPHWTDDERLLDTQLKDLNQHRWTTKICLPLRAESHQTRNLFHDVHPSLLLFLHRLRSISIFNQSENRVMTMTRKDLSHNVLEVEHTEGTERWLVVKTTLQPKKIKEDVESTELALAFQLDSSITESDLVCQPQKQPVFAYLPLRSFGFRFIIQGDFDIPSSREDVDRDSSWNQWLRSEIPQLFLQAMDVFTDHPEFKGLKGLCQFLQFIPLPDEVLDFFKPVAGQIIQMLKGKAFLPTLSSDGKVVYKLPSQVAVCQDAVIRNVIGGDELERHLSLSYLHPGLSPAPPTSLLTHLGVRYLRGSDVTTVTTAMAKELMEGIHSDGGLRQLAKLLVCNFRALEHGYGEADSILQSLRDLPIIPLADGRMVALNGEGVFFPLEESKTKKKKKAEAQTGPLSALYQDVNVVHPSLLSCVEALESQQVRELLKRLGVHELEPQELLEQHIYPSIKGNTWKSKPEAVIVSYLVFIKLHSSSSHEYSDTAVPVLTSRGLLCPANERVHFSEEYGNMNLPEKLPGCDWILLDPCYVQTDGDVAGWRELFSKLGVRDGLIIRKERQTLTAKDLASSPWSVESAMWHQIPGEGFVLDDYPCEEFHALATAQLPGHLLLQQRMALLELLATNWDTGHCYSQYLKAQVIDGDGQPIKSTKSSFYHFLQHLEWVPAYRPQEGDRQERNYLRPNSVYLTSPEVTSLLGTHVCYVDIGPSEFSKALGMRQNISVEALIKYLKEWCVKPKADDQEQRLPADELEGANFTSTVEHIHNVYSYLSNNCPQGSLKELFQHTPAVFIEYNRRNDVWCSGRFYHLKEVCWSDPTMLFQRYKQLTQAADSPVQPPIVLAPFYNPLDGMKAFFTRLLNVDLSPNMKQYVGLLEVICSSSPIPTAEVLQDVSVLYARLAQKCKIQVYGDQENVPQSKLSQSYCSTLKGMVSNQRVFPTKDNTWVTLARRPMIADNKELEKVFKPHKQICLLQLPPAEKKTAPKSKKSNFGERANPVPAFNETDRSLFLEICGIRQLTQCVKTEAVTESLRPCPSMQAMVHNVVPYIQRFLYHHDELPEVYSELIDNNIAEKIKRLSFGQVGKLYIRYQLDVADSEDAVVELQDVICLLKDEKELYIQKDHLSAKLDICRELVKLFCTEISHRKELMHFLSGLITSLSEPASLKRFLGKEDIRELPSEEELWEVPEPPKPEINLERVLSRSYSSTSSHEEPPRFAQQDGEQTLVCWPPRASILNTGASRSAGQADSSAVEAVMKMWPPPAGPKDRDPEKDSVNRGSSHVPVPQSPSSSSGYEGSQPTRSSRPTEQPGLQRVLSPPGQPKPAAETTSTPRPPEHSQQSETTECDRAETGEESLAAPRPDPSPPSAQPAETTSDQPAPNSLAVPEAVVLSGTFQGAAETPRPPLNLVWNHAQPPQPTLEDMELTCGRPSTVVLSEDQMDVAVIGEWGEQLVNSFLCHWRDSGDPSRPAHVLWCNQSGESGQPYDFKLTFDPGVVYVEVKSTVKKEKSFIHMSANELDFALKEKERYHIFRVYSAGDAHNVRLCRIQNLAQHLHTKDLALYLFV